MIKRTIVSYYFFSLYCFSSKILWKKTKQKLHSKWNESSRKYVFLLFIQLLFLYMPRIAFFFSCTKANFSLFLLSWSEYVWEWEANMAGEKFGGERGTMKLEFLSHSHRIVGNKMVSQIQWRRRRSFATYFFFLYPLVK